MDTNAKNLLLMSLANYYRQSNTMSQIVGIINSKSRVSLRLLDWHITNYSKKYSTTVQAENGTNVNIYVSYRSQLKAYSKSKFDPFRRRSRIFFYYEKDAYIETTIGQLNFFRWILQNNILRYLLENLDVIEKDMLSSHAAKRLESQTLSIDNSRTINQPSEPSHVIILPAFVVNFD